MTLSAHATAALTALERVPLTAADYQLLTDAELLSLSAVATSLQRLANTHAALIDGDIARRSARELGHDGLAQRLGFRTPEELVRVTSGSTAREATHAVRVGTLVHDSQSATPVQPWLRPVSDALVDGSITVAAADSIRNGLGEPTGDIPASALQDAAAELCALASPTDGPGLDADRLYRRARELRDDLDENGIADRETALRDKRGLSFKRLPDGMGLAIWHLDPVSAAEFGDYYDRSTSPRRGGPRFVHGDDAVAAERIAADERTTEQLASDVFLELFRHGAAAGTSQLLGTGPAVVRVLVTRPTLDSRQGHGWLEGAHDPLSIETIERMACSGAVQPIYLDEGANPLELGREQRLFNKRQRIALAVRDGGCMWVGCDRPPSWTEAHHIQHWQRDHGATDIANGILLCRHHHLLLHNKHWQIVIDEDEFWLIPPRDVDPQQHRRPMRSRSRAIHELRMSRQPVGAS